MRAFGNALRARQPANADARGRRWVYVPYDQLTSDVGPLSREDPRELGAVFIEAPAKAARRPYHKQKLAFVLASMRHFALELAERGVLVRYLVAEPHQSYAEVLETQARSLGPLRMMRAAERELRAELAPLVERGLVEVVPHEGWLTSTEDFVAAQAGPPWRMDLFYRHVRRTTGLLMRDGRPEGGKLSFDTENRRPWKGEPPAPSPPHFAADAITTEVCDRVGQRFAHHPGRLDPESLAVTRAHAEALLAFALRECLPAFGPFEDAMATSSRTLFHSRLSPLLNVLRLLPRRVVELAARAEAPIASREGFVRQILGWREFMRHVHEATDGFRAVAPRARGVGDGGYARWSGRAWPGGADASLAGAAPALDGQDTPVPPAFWGTTSGLHCLDTVVRGVWEDAWSHHISRLMILGNIAQLLDVSPRELADWFWVAYVDAYDWVVEPNVLAMATFGTGPLLTTKPYVSGAGYIHKMSDYCGGCRFDPKRSCPLTAMYWAYLERHRAELADVPRMMLPLRAAGARSAAQKKADRATFERVRDALVAGRALEPPDDGASR